MKNNKHHEKIEKAKINIYNILAVLIVIIPEFFAEFIFEIGLSQINNQLPRESDEWSNNEELKLSKMNILELRLLAQKLSIHGYSNENRNSLIKRITRKSQNRKFKRIIKYLSNR